VRPPAAYVIINGADVTGMTALDTVRITFNEDQAATAAVFMFVEMGAPVNIPSFHGKSIRIETHTDPNDINSEIIPLFNGWIETARHDRQRMGIEFRATDLRDERLGRESRQQLQQMTSALYSTVTQREDVNGREYVTELMRTAAGSLNYTRDGSLRYYSWGMNMCPTTTLAPSSKPAPKCATASRLRCSIGITCCVVCPRWLMPTNRACSASAAAAQNPNTMAAHSTAIRCCKKWNRLAHGS
jgi:hypothetical protein